MVNKPGRAAFYVILVDLIEARRSLVAAGEFRLGFGPAVKGIAEEPPKSPR